MLFQRLVAEAVMDGGIEKELNFPLVFQREMDQAMLNSTLNSDIQKRCSSHHNHHRFDVYQIASAVAALGEKSGSTFYSICRILRSQCQDKRCNKSCNSCRLSVLDVKRKLILLTIETLLLRLYCLARKSFTICFYLPSNFRNSSNTWQESATFAIILSDCKGFFSCSHTISVKIKISFWSQPRLIIVLEFETNYVIVRPITSA